MSNHRVFYINIRLNNVFPPDDLWFHPDVDHGLLLCCHMRLHSILMQSSMVSSNDNLFFFIFF